MAAAVEWFFCRKSLKRPFIPLRRRKDRPTWSRPSPQGELLSQEIVETLAAREHTVIICGHYEGLDERFIEKRVDREISRAILSSPAEIPAMAIIDAMARLVPGSSGRSRRWWRTHFSAGCLIILTSPVPRNGREFPPGCSPFGPCGGNRELAQE